MISSVALFFFLDIQQILSVSPDSSLQCCTSACKVNATVKPPPHLVSKQRRKQKNDTPQEPPSVLSRTVSRQNGAPWIQPSVISYARFTYAASSKRSAYCQLISSGVFKCRKNRLDALPRRPWRGLTPTATCLRQHSGQQPAPSKQKDATSNLSFSGTKRDRLTSLKKSRQFLVVTSPSSPRPPFLLTRIQPALRATRPLTSLRVRCLSAMSSYSVKTQCAPFRYCR